MARPLAWLLAAGAALGAPAAGAQSIDGYPASRFIEQHERFTPDGGSPVDLKFLIAREGAAHTPRLVQATQAALTLLSSWFGPLPSPLTVAGVPWRGSAAAAAPRDVITTPLRLLTPARDRSMERALIAATVGQYWPPRAAGARPSTFEESLLIYIGGRAIDHLLETRNFATARFFGGFVPLPLRPLSLSPPLSDSRPRAYGFDDPASIDAGVARGVRALQTLERYVGWPTMLEALSRMRTAGTSPTDAGALAAALSDARGSDMEFLVAECFRPDAVFDYALADLQSRAESGLVETTVTIVRQGPGIFSSGSDSQGRTPLMPVRVRFADGSELRDFFDGAAPSATLLYTAPTAAVSATVDPDLMLLLDVNRANNAIVRDARTAPLGIRLALNWMAWLQNAMLTYTAIV